MTWDTAANIASVIEAVVVTVSLAVVAYQIRQQTHLTRAANTSNLFQMSSEFNLQLVQDPNLAEMWLAASESVLVPSTPEERIEEFRRRNLVMWWLMLHENIYHQHRSGFLQPEVFDAWKADLQSVISKPGVEGRFDEIAAFLTSEFAKYVRKLRNCNGTD